MTANKINKRMRLKRAIMLCDMVIEDLQVADLDIVLHRKITALHQELLIKHHMMMEGEREVVKTCDHAMKVVGHGHNYSLSRCTKCGYEEEY